MSDTRTKIVDPNDATKVSVRVYEKAANPTNEATKTVTTAATKVQLSTTSSECMYVRIVAKAANTGYLYVGGNAVDSTNYAFRIAPGKGRYVPTDNLNKIYLDAETSLNACTYYVYT